MTRIGWRDCSKSKKFQADLGDADAIVKRECGTSVKEILAARRLMAKEPK